MLLGWSTKRLTVSTFAKLALATVAMCALPSALSGPRHDDAHASARLPAGESPSVITPEDLASRFPGLDPADVHESQVAGLYEVVVRNKISYVTTDGRFLIRGDIVDLSTQANLTEQRRVETRAALFAAIDPATEIVFSPKDGVVKHRVIVFTDVDCTYCRQLHRDIAETNALGIEVRYVAYPRTGPNTKSWAKAENVWCAADRNAALTQAKRGSAVAPIPGCTSTPVAEEYQLGRRIGLSGTPGVYSESGVELGGYLPPKDLLAELERIAAAKK
jgi:thiol:disulfide interchange protein DsbC